MRNQPSGDKEYLDDDFDLDELLDGMDEEDAQAAEEKRGKPSGVRAFEGDRRGSRGQRQGNMMERRRVRGVEQGRLMPMQTRRTAGGPGSRGAGRPRARGTE